MQDEKYQQKSKSISSAEPNYFVHFAMRHPVDENGCKTIYSIRFLGKPLFEMRKDLIILEQNLEILVIVW